MIKLLKSLLVVVIILVVLAVGAGIALFAVSGWDLKNLKYESREYEIDDEFTKIAIETKGTDVNVLPSTDDKCKVICFENNNYKHTASVVDGTLVINEVFPRKVFFGFKDTYITVYLPEKEYESLTIATTSGDVDVKKITALSVDVTVDSGDVEIENLVCNSLNSKGDSGDIDLEIVVATQSINLERDSGEIDCSLVSTTGDVTIITDSGDVSLDQVACNNLTTKGDSASIEFDNVAVISNLLVTSDSGDFEFIKLDANNLEITTISGSISGSLTSEKIFAISTSSGSIRVPQTTSGGICKITTRSGDVEITLSAK